MDDPAPRRRLPLTTKMKRCVRQSIGSLGFEIVRKPNEFPPDFSPADRKIYQVVKDFTLTPPERIFALCRALEYIVSAPVAGSIVECGVWRGGSMMAACLELILLGDTERELYLYDTFEGMPDPDDSVDVDAEGTTASVFLSEGAQQGHPMWDHAPACAYAPIDDVRSRLESTGYPSARMHLVAGKVEDTLPEQAPESIALLRLDTDWYESTRHEMEHLFPRVVPGGVLVLDDYGHWKGSQKAVDEYLEAHGIRMLLNRIDYSARLGIVGTPASVRG